MSVKVLIVRPSGNSIIYILAEGVHLYDSNVEFTIFESDDKITRKPEKNIDFIDTEIFSKKMPNYLRVYFLGKELIKGNFNRKKARHNAGTNLRYFYFKKYYKETLSKFDIININFLQATSIDLLRLVPKNKKIMISLWGSDVFRSTDEIVKQQKKALDIADVITLHSHEMKDYFLKKYGKKYNDKIKIVLFGSSYKTIQLVNEIKSQTSYSCQKLLGIDHQKIVVRLGYSADPGQQHVLIIDELDKLSKDYKSKIHIILQLTYGGPAEYKHKVAKRIEDTGINFTVFNDFLPQVEVLEIAKRSDVFLNLRTTDALNNSMIESFLFNKLVICGDWLPYQIVEDNGVIFQKIPAISEVNLKLTNYIDNQAMLDDELSVNSAAIEKLVSNKNTGEIWAKMYHDLLGK